MRARELAGTRWGRSALGSVSGLAACSCVVNLVGKGGVQPRLGGRWRRRTKGDGGGPTRTGRRRLKLGQNKLERD